MIGWIKLHRQIKNWEWYYDINTCWLFNHLLLTVNYEHSKYMGYEIPVGSRVIGFKALASQIPLTIQQIRTSLKRLEKSGEVTIKTTNKFSIISITKWGEYQTDNKRITNEQHANNKPITTSKEAKKEEDKKEYIGDFSSFWDSWIPNDMVKGNKKPAEAKYLKAIKSGVPEKKIIFRAKQYCEDCKKRNVKTQHVVTWLNQAGWETDYSQQAPQVKWNETPHNRMPSPAGG